MKSLDPRVQRLPNPGQPGQILPKAPLDQFGTFEVFVKPKEGRPFQHEGALHAPNLEMAFVLAKETFTRRFTCTSLCVADTRNVFVSPFTDADKSVYDILPDSAGLTQGPREKYEIFHLQKRGKQHVHAGSLDAAGPEEAMRLAKSRFGEKIVLNVWVVRAADIRFTAPGENDLWNTLPEKKFRDASEYKGGDKLKSFLESRQP